MHSKLKVMVNYKVRHIVVKGKKIIMFINRQCSSVRFHFEVTRLKTKKLKIRLYSVTDYRYKVISLTEYKNIISTQKKLFGY